nr:hypothetical protein [Helcococcus sueciensis]
MNKLKKINKIYFLVAIILVISLLAFALSGINKKELNLKINDEKVGEEEYFRAMSLKLNEVKMNILKEQEKNYLTISGSRVKMVKIQ